MTDKSVSGESKPRKSTLSPTMESHKLISHRLRNARILLITIRALSNEIAKNLVLAGIGSLTVQDDQSVVSDDLGSQFFISEDDIGKNVKPSAVSFRLSLTSAPACRSSRASDPQAQPKSHRKRRDSEY